MDSSQSSDPKTAVGEVANAWWQLRQNDDGVPASPDPVMSAIGMQIVGTLASTVHLQLKEKIIEFEASIGDDEVGLRVVGLGQSLQIHLQNVSFRNPSLLIFDGRDQSGMPVTLVQHVTQTNLVFVPVPKSKPDGPKTRIGFCMPNTDPPSN